LPLTPETVKKFGVWALTQRYKQAQGSSQALLTRPIKLKADRLSIEPQRRWRKPMSPYACAAQMHRRSSALKKILLSFLLWIPLAMRTQSVNWREQTSLPLLWNSCRALRGRKRWIFSSSQANLAGYRAVIEAAAEYGRSFPMMMTAAGTVPAAKIFIMGVGVAGLQAIATARRLGAIVTATDVRPATKDRLSCLARNSLRLKMMNSSRLKRLAVMRRKCRRSIKKRKLNLSHHIFQNKTLSLQPRSYLVVRRQNL